MRFYVRGGLWAAPVVFFWGVLPIAASFQTTAALTAPSSAPVCALGHLPPGGWKACPAGDGGFAVGTRVGQGLCPCLSYPVLSPCLVPIPFYPLTGIGKGRTLALRAVVVERIAGPGGDGEGMRNPPVTACGGASPLWQGGLWSGDDHWEVLVGAGLRPGPSPGSMWFQKGGAGQSPPPTALPTAVFGLSCGIGA